MTSILGVVLDKKPRPFFNATYDKAGSLPKLRSHTESMHSQREMRSRRLHCGAMFVRGVLSPLANQVAGRNTIMAKILRAVAVYNIVV